MSVRLMCYNQEKYIAQAIESILMQQTNFDMEIVVGDDFSTDNTLQIIYEYEKKHPLIFHVLEREREDVRYQLRQKYGRLYNFVDILAHCQGEYITLLDGDDYWISPHKLQKQVDILEQNHEIAGCFSNAIIVNDNDEVIADDFFDYHNLKVKPEIRTEDIVPFGISPCNTLLFRRDILSNPPDWFTRNIRHSGFDLLITLHGSLFCINEKLGAYRIHTGGIWSLSLLSYRLTSDLLFLKPLYFDEYMHKHFEPIIRETIKRKIISLMGCRSEHKGYRKIACNLKSFLCAYPRAMGFFPLVPYWILRNSLGKWFHRMVCRLKNIQPTAGI